MVNFWILPTTMEHWELVKAHNVYAFQREVDRDKIKPGDIGIFYVIRSDPPVLVGVYEIAEFLERATEPFWTQEKAEGKVIWPWRFRLTQRRLGAVDVRKLSRQLSFVENKEVWHVYFFGSLANFGRPIPESDYRLVFDELAKPAISYQVKTAAKPKVLTAAKILPKKREIPQLRGPPPSHNELRDMIRDIGIMKNLLVDTEYPINGMRLDVAWRMPVRENPDHAWEVQIGGNFFEALAKLKHAWDLWKADPYLVTTERFEEQARKLLGGTFHEIKPHIRIINWQEIVKLYKLLRDTTDMEKELRI
jgi:predicted RNA-binding protein